MKRQTRKWECKHDCTQLRTRIFWMRSQKSAGGLVESRSRGLTKQLPCMTSTIAVKFCQHQTHASKRMEENHTRVGPKRTHALEVVQDRRSAEVAHLRDFQALVRLPVGRHLLLERLVAVVVVVAYFAPHLVLLLCKETQHITISIVSA